MIFAPVFPGRPIRNQHLKHLPYFGLRDRLFFVRHGVSARFIIKSVELDFERFHDSSFQFDNGSAYWNFIKGDLKF